MSLNSDIELYMSKMENILNVDILKKILTIININIIKKQKILKNQLNQEINKYKDVYYKDNKFLIYKNKLNNIAIRNRFNYSNNINLKLIKVKNNTINNDDNINNIILNNTNNIIYEKNLNNNEMNILDDNIILDNTSNIENLLIYVKYI
jgi:hypothetical protein|tara:strand:+ start:424 stop:873 length:450 start_codon:yes stop_codon:yes gene_type:complete